MEPEKKPVRRYTRNYYIYNDHTNKKLTIQFYMPDGTAKKLALSYKGKTLASVRSELIKKYKLLCPQKRIRKKNPPYKYETLQEGGKTIEQAKQEKKEKMVEKKNVEEKKSDKKEMIEEKKPVVEEKMVEVKKEDFKEPEKTRQIKPLDLIEVDYAEELPFKQYFSEPKTLGIVGVGRSGKTNLLCRMYNDCLRDMFDVNTITTGTMGSDAYKDLKKDKEIVWLNEVCEDYMKAQYTLAKETKGKWYKFLNIYDDINPDNRFTNMIQRAITKHRNIGVSSIFSIQSKTFLNPTMRSNLHGMIIMNTKRLEKGYLDTFADVLRPYFDYDVKKDEIIKWMIENTRNFHFIFVDSFEDKIYLCKNKLKE